MFKKRRNKDLPGKELSDKELADLAFDVAQEYFTDEQILRRHGLSLSQFRDIKEQPAFVRTVDDIVYGLQDDGAYLAVRARQHLEEILEFHVEVLNDPGVSLGMRQKSADKLLELARVRKVNTEAPGDSGFKLVIHTNLSLGDDSKEGAYRITAQPTQTVEGEFEEVPDFAKGLI